MADTLPAGARMFLFDPVAWRGSRRVHTMPLPARALYIELLCEQWERGSVPSTPEECARSLGEALDVWQAAWPHLIECFTLRKKDNRRANPKLDLLRRNQLKRVRNAREYGRQGAKSRWGSKKRTPANDREPIATLRGGHGNKSKVNRSTSTKKDLRTSRVHPPKVRAHSQTRARARESAINGRASLAVREGFARFFAAYPKREAEADAWHEWKALKPDDALTRKILDAIAWQRQKSAWIREGGRYVPLPAKWLRDRRFNDQPPDTPLLSDATIAVLRAGAEFENS